MRLGFPYPYMQTTNVDRHITDIWRDFDQFACDIDVQDTDSYGNAFVQVVLPPLFHDGKFIKGLLITQAADLLAHRYPFIRRLFHVAATSMVCGMPTAKHADALLMPYENPAREAWYRSEYPERASMKLIGGVYDSDFFNEHHYTPTNTEKDIDVLCIGRLDVVKNLGMFGRGMAAFAAQNPQRNFRAVVLTGAGTTDKWENLTEHGVQQLGFLRDAVQTVADKVHIEPAYKDVRDYVRRSRVLVLCSLVEGRNRSVHEAMSCNVPVVVFEHCNQYARPAGTPALPPGGGVMATAFTPEALAQAISDALDGKTDLSPRDAVVTVSGKRVVLDKMIESFAYYAENLPGYALRRHIYNPWIDQAMHRMYDCSLHDYLYRSAGPGSNYHKGIEAMDQLMHRYSALVPLSG
jgi:glycosyltransferase involved in cell wall biosynthesis